MKKIVILIIALTVVMSACVKTKEPTRFSILGDSYSTYEGYVYPDSNNVYPYDEIGVTGVEQMWWQQVSDSNGWLLERNNSFSGSLICNLNASNYYGPYSFIRRMNNLGNPNVIFILGGTNDVWNDAPFGDYVYSDWTEEQLCNFRPALAYLFDNMKRLYPNAKLYFILETNPCPDGIELETRFKLIESTHRIARHYNVNCIDLYEVHKKHWHPDVQGQKDIAVQVLEFLAAENL